MDALSGSACYSVTHLGVPIGTVVLPDGRDWAGGLLTPLPAFERVGETIAAARDVAGRDVAAVLKLPLGERLPAEGRSRRAVDVLDALAALEFGLTNERGLFVPTDMVRLADPGDGKGVRVYAYFRGSTAGKPASRPAAPRSPGDVARGV